MFGFPLAGPENIFFDNNGFVKNTKILESTLSEKHNSINCHYVHESAAAGILYIRKEYTATNIVNPLTNFLPYSRKLELIVCLIYNY